MGDVGIDPLATVERVTLDDTSWIDVARGWLTGSDAVFDVLLDRLAWRQRRDIPMYDKLVDEPRLTHWWSGVGGSPEPMSELADLRVQLSNRYRVEFDSIGFNLYRTGADSVAWHGDRHREDVVDPVVAIVSVGNPRPLRLRPRAGGQSVGSAPLAWNLGCGDLFVMGGACQSQWEHAVPKVRAAGPRMSITFRHGATRTLRR